MMSRRGETMAEEMKKEAEETVEESTKEEAEEVKEETTEETAEETVDPKDEKIKDLESQINKWKTDYYKVFADMENLKKRLKNEHANQLKYAMQSFIEELLPVIDNYERSLTVEPESEEGKNILKGNKMILNQLMNILGKNGVTSSNTTSLTSPVITPPWIAAPIDTTSSGLTDLLGSFPNNLLTDSCTAMIRVEPPTSKI